MSVYTVEATREGEYWLLHVVEIDKYTQARHLSEAEVTAKELIEIFTGSDADTISVRLHVNGPDKAQGAGEAS